MKILKNKTYENLIEDSECLHKFWKDEKQKKKKEKDKKDAELEKLPDAPKKFMCDDCEGTGYSEKKFKRFKKKFINYYGKEVIQEKFLCIDCLDKITRSDYEEDDGD